jgi:hypothetical protein
MVKVAATAFVELPLDLWLGAYGKQTLLDERSFQALPPDAAEVLEARKPLDELRAPLNEQNPPGMAEGSVHWWPLLHV